MAGTSPGSRAIVFFGTVFGGTLHEIRQIRAKIAQKRVRPDVSLGKSHRQSICCHLFDPLAAVAAVVASAFRDSRPGEENRLLGRLQSDSPRAFRFLPCLRLHSEIVRLRRAGRLSHSAPQIRGLRSCVRQTVDSPSGMNGNWAMLLWQLAAVAAVVASAFRDSRPGEENRLLGRLQSDSPRAVFRFLPNGTSAELVLGEAFVPGSGSGHFCQPTDVALPPSGLVFISDGYCNSRIAIFTPEGKHVTDVATRDGLWIPHSLTYVQRDNTVCVADRENQRVLCFWAGLGPDFGFLRSSVTGQLGRVYAVASVGSYLYGLQIDDGTSAASGFRVELYPGSRVQTFSPRQRFIQPHDLAVSEDGRTLYAVDVDAANRKKVYKFRI
ncbi:peptidyl-glycine alpha-amidating monooxygenase, putative [Ixodes scapularis]|uniref:Peptidyl-glycine alpha-amidating monooxygenase, putative n=1 Tax=Ixodes scapularis TaxID=6945 RepID=B7PHV3_IXOSC|nr:peptidyl-glycine alpha-amidating monooxygenase, putative [Ixodes scapularis]|eukprot:XP_002403665.1 peptidyl-glycine alpha-amidating monooxygenase, putative [Ixodes scapularis]